MLSLQRPLIPSYIQYREEQRRDCLLRTVRAVREGRTVKECQSTSQDSAKDQGRQCRLYWSQPMSHPLVPGYILHESVFLLLSCVLPCYHRSLITIPRPLLFLANSLNCPAFAIWRTVGLKGQLLRGVAESRIPSRFGDVLTHSGTVSPCEPGTCEWSFFFASQRKTY